jgi:putative aldouronate transport system substrate-binding protein
MNKALKKGFAQLTWLGVSISLLAGCNGNGASPTPQPTQRPSAEGKSGSLPLTDKPVTFTWFISERPDAKVKNDWDNLTEIAKRTNVHIKFEAVPAAGFNEKKKIMMATNSMVDFNMVSVNEAALYGPQGMFLKLNDLIDKHAPNLKAHFEKYPSAKLIATAADGNIYNIPQFKPQLNLHKAFMIRKDLLDKYNLKMPSNTEQFYQTLKELKSKHPDSYPFTMSLGAPKGLYNIFTRAFTESNLLGFHPGTKKFTFAAENPRFKEALTYMNKLYNEGLMDPEFAIIQEPQWEQRILTEKAFATFDWGSRPDIFNGKIKGANFVHMAPIVADGVKPYEFLTEPVDNIGISVAAGIKSPELAVKFLDYLFSDEGSKLMNYGVEGKNYTMENGKPKFIGVDYQGNDKFIYGLGYNGIAINKEKYNMDFALELTENQKNLKQIVGKDYIEGITLGGFSEKETQTLAEKQVNVDKYMDERMTAFIMGKTQITDEAIKEFINQSVKLGAKEIIDIQNAVYTRNTSKR